MTNVNKFIYQQRSSGFVANGIDVDNQIYITISAGDEHYISVDELQKDEAGTISGVGWFADLIRGGIASEISEARFRELLDESRDRGFGVHGNAKEKLGRFLVSGRPRGKGAPIDSIEPVIRFPHDIRIAADLRRSVEHQTFGVVKKRFRAGRNQGAQLLIVQDPYKLEEVAAFLVDPRGHTGLGFGLGMFRRGLVRVGVDDLDKVDEGFRLYAELLESIDDDLPCEVVYIEPSYVVKLSKIQEDNRRARSGWAFWRRR